MDETLSVGLFFYVVFLFSTVCHEASHAAAAMLLGDLTAYHAGQVSLNPVPHIQREPFGLGLLPIITLFTSMYSGGLGVFGFASAPFDPYWAMRNPKRAAWMAMAGPGANFVLAGAGILALRAGLAFGLFHPSPEPSIWKLAQGTGGVSDGVAVFLSVLFFENLLLGIWNMLPIPPMDGFSMLLFVLPESRIGWFFQIRQEVGMMFPLIMFGISSMFWKIFLPISYFIIGTVLFSR